MGLAVLDLAKPMTLELDVPAIRDRLGLGSGCVWLWFYTKKNAWIRSDWVGLARMERENNVKTES